MGENNFELIEILANHYKFKSRENVFNLIDDVTQTDNDDNDVLMQICTIEESFQSFTSFELQKITQIKTKKFVIAIQSKIDKKFFIVWKLTELYMLKVLDKGLKYEALEILCQFAVEFLEKCLKNNHSGEFSVDNKNLKLILISRF